MYVYPGDLLVVATNEFLLHLLRKMLSKFYGKLYLSRMRAIQSVEPAKLKSHEILTVNDCNLFLFSLLFSLLLVGVIYICTKHIYYEIRPSSKLKQTKYFSSRRLKINGSMIFCRFHIINLKSLLLLIQCIMIFAVMQVTKLESNRIRKMRKKVTFFMIN